jgi:ribose transport system ATP-binding protein
LIANDAPPTLEVRDLGKRFGAIQALTQFSLEVRAGEIHGLVGANGAGKSTLVKLLAGVESPDEGEILLDGQPVRIRDARHSRELGFSFIHQELNLIPKLTAIQNMTLGLTRHTRLGLIDWRATKRDVADVAARLDIRAPLDTPVENLSTADRWLISIGAALIGNAKLVAMDEPTASLSKEESERLFRIIRGLSSAGVPILYVSHRLEEILSLCSRVTVLKDGHRVVTLERDEISNADLVRHIVGADVTPLAGSGRHAVGTLMKRSDGEWP